MFCIVTYTIGISLLAHPANSIFLLYIRLLVLKFFSVLAYGPNITSRKAPISKRGLLDLVVMDRPDEKNVFFHSFTPLRSTESQLMPHKPTVDDLRKLNFLFKNEIVIYIHGFKIEPTKKAWLMDFAKNWARVHRKNSIVVDWSISSGTLNYLKVSQK